MIQSELFSYAYDFVSQIIENKKIFDSVRSIILFGSVARGNFDKDSDVDIFIDIKNEKNIEDLSMLLKREQHKFEIRCEKTWFLRKIDLPIKVTMGDINSDRWENLKDEISAYGKFLYGDLKISETKIRPYVLVSYRISELSQKNKMSFLREIYGYKNKKNKKEYVKEGLIKKINAKKLGVNVVMVQKEEISKIKSLLSKYKISYELKEILAKF